MAHFLLSAFGDEIDQSLDVQMDELSKHAIRYIEVRGVDGRNISEISVSDAALIHERLKRRGFGVSALGSPIGKISILQAFEPHFDVFKRLLDVARELETGYIRMFSFYMPEGADITQHRDEVFRRVDAMLTAARGTDVQLLHENESGIYGDKDERCFELMERFGGALHMTYDPSNFGNCGVDNKVALPMLRRYVRYVHMKDSVNKVRSNHRDPGFQNVSDKHRPCGEGDCDVKWVLEQLSADGFDGFLSIEPHLSSYAGVPGNGATKFAVAVKAVKGLLSDIGAEYA